MRASPLPPKTSQKTPSDAAMKATTIGGSSIDTCSSGAAGGACSCSWPAQRRGPAGRAGKPSHQAGRPCPPAQGNWSTQASTACAAAGSSKGQGRRASSNVPSEHMPAACHARLPACLSRTRRRAKQLRQPPPTPLHPAWRVSALLRARLGWPSTLPPPHVEVGPLVVAHMNAPAHPVELGVQQQRVHRPLLQRRRGQRPPAGRHQTVRPRQEPLPGVLLPRIRNRPWGFQALLPTAPGGTSRRPQQRRPRRRPRGAQAAARAPTAALPVQPGSATWRGGRERWPPPGETSLGPERGKTCAAAFRLQRVVAAQSGTQQERPAAPAPKGLLMKP